MYIFSDKEMKGFLIRLGYSVVEEKEVVERDYYHTTESIEVDVINVYRNGSKMCEWIGYGNRRLREVFEQEMKRKMLN